MNHFIDIKKEILIPIQIVEITFNEKEEVSLSLFQKFILEAIELGKGIDQIVEATLLTKNVVETEIKQLIKQKLLIQENKTLFLSQLSKKLLMISRCVKSLNDEKKYISINLITGEIEPFDSDKTIDYKDESYLFFNSKISEKDIDGISLENNISFFEKYMDSFHGMNESDINTVLSSIFAEFKKIGNSKYIKKELYKIPCAIGEENLKKQDEDLIIAKGLLYKIEYKVESAILRANQDILSDLNKINEYDNDLISDKGHHLLELQKRCLQYKKQPLICYYDAVSGLFQFEHIDINRKVKYHLQLPLLNDISIQTKECIINELREQYNITDDFCIKEISCEKECYSIECEVLDLLGENNE